MSRAPHETLQRRKRGAKTYNSKCDGRKRKVLNRSALRRAENAMQKVHVMQLASRIMCISMYVRREASEGAALSTQTARLIRFAHLFIFQSWLNF